MFAEGGNEGWERFRKRQGKTLRKVLSKARKLEKNKSKQVKRFGNVEVEEGMGAAYMPKAGTQGVPEREVTSKAVKKQLNRNRNRAQMKGDLETPSIRYTHSRDKSTDYIRPVKKRRIHKKKVKEEVMIEGSKPNNPKLWAAKKAAAKAKFDVYPSAYANGWAAKQYKAAGGTWRSESVEHDLNELSSKTYKDYIRKAASPVNKSSAVNLASKGAHKLATSDNMDAGEKEDKKAFNRGQGIQRAAKKLYSRTSDKEIRKEEKNCGCGKDPCETYGMPKKMTSEDVIAVLGEITDRYLISEECNLGEAMTPSQRKMAANKIFRMHQAKQAAKQANSPAAKAARRDAKGYKTYDDSHLDKPAPKHDAPKRGRGERDLPHIATQLRGVVDMGAKHSGVKFKDGTTKKVSPEHAKSWLKKHDSSKPAQRLAMYKSHDSHSEFQKHK